MVLAASGAALVCAGGQPVQAQAINVGDHVDCKGHIGQVVRSEPRPGWDEPFYVVSVPGSVPYEIRCVPSDMHLTDVVTPPATGTSSLCQLGARLEALWGSIYWYEVTVTGPANAAGQCPVHFEGYAPLYDTYINPESLRLPGGGPIQKPDRPWQEAREVTPPDGIYECGKISLGAGFFPAGSMEVNGGQVRVVGLPDGAIVLSVKLIDTMPNGVPSYAVDYQLANGNSDRLDCE